MIQVIVEGIVWEIKGNNERICANDIENNRRTELTEYVRKMFKQRYGCTAIIK
jgi:hypothetical protein